MNMDEATVDDGQLVFASGATLPMPPVPPSLTAGQKVTFGLRPDDFYPTGHGLSSGDAEAVVQQIELPVTITEPLGNETLVFVEFNGRDWVSRMLNPRPLPSGQTIKMSFDLSQAHLFDLRPARAWELRNHGPY
jgi:multiple sugar transport system ATP-binding protein